jgi:hypothetical protein
MTRRWLTFVVGLALTWALVPEAWSQPEAQRPTLAQRLGAFGRSFTPGNTTEPVSPAPARPRAGAANTSQNVRTPADEPATTTFPQVDGQSLLPTNLFGRPGGLRTSTAGRQSPGRMPLADSADLPTPEAGSRTATRPLGGVGAAGERAPYTLPGLGGSPFPADMPGEPTETVGAPARSAIEATAEPTLDSARADARHSPQRRTATQVNPNDLRRELADAFPAAAKDSTTAAEPGPGATAPTADTESIGRGDGDSNFKADSIFTLPVNKGLSSGAADAGPADSNTSKQPNASGRPLTTNDLRPAPRSQPTFETQAARIPAANNDSLLVTNQTPLITTDIHGPKQVQVGREAAFRVRLNNQGDAAADGIVATVRIPSWAEVIDTAATSGTIGQSASVSGTAGGAATGTVGGSGTVLEWQISRLAARSGETLNVRLIPRTSRPLELGITWTLAPVGSRAVVEVQEPKLDMHVSGPDEVLFGKPQLYRFTLSNPGSGVAENVKIELFPPGGGEQAVTSNPLGNLPPGKSQTVEVELIARDAGKLTIKALASAEGGLTYAATKEVFCRKPELSVDWRGPEMKYAGTDATYFFRVRNPGTAVAEGVAVRVALPDGARLVSASEGQVYDAARNAVTWRVGSLGPGDDYYMELKCTVNTPGINQLKVESATAAGDLSDNKLAETNVVALADLKLEVSDPTGPVAVGDDAAYEIRVHNRGANTASDIFVVALFSQGIEPDQAEGGAYSVTDGRVAFPVIDELPAGRQAVLRIRARAVEPGAHVFRAEVLCRDLDTKLAAEETTRFYADDAASGGDGEGHQASNSKDGFDSAPR